MRRWACVETAKRGKFVYMHTCVHTYASGCPYTSHTYIHTHIHTHTCRSSFHVSSSTYVHTYTHTPIHAGHPCTSRFRTPTSRKTRRFVYKRHHTGDGDAYMCCGTQFDSKFVCASVYVCIYIYIYILCVYIYIYIYIYILWDSI